MAQLVFEFKPSGDGVGLYCHKIGGFTARGLEVIKDAITKQWKDQLTIEEEAAKTEPLGTAHVGQKDWDGDPYDPSRYDPKRYEL